MAIRDWPADERPREKLLEKGAAALSDAELLAILLRTGTPGHSALSGAQCSQELSFAAQADRLRPAAVLRGAGLGTRSLCGIASVGRDRQKATVGDPARRPFPFKPTGHPGFKGKG